MIVFLSRWRLIGQQEYTCRLRRWWQAPLIDNGNNKEECMLIYYRCRHTDVPSFISTDGNEWSAAKGQACSCRFCTSNFFFFFWFFWKTISEGQMTTPQTAVQLSAIQTIFNCLHFMTRQPRRLEAYLLLQQIKFRRILPFAVLFCRGKHFHIHGALHSPKEPETISIERCIHFIVFHLPLHNTEYYTQYTITRP